VGATAIQYPDAPVRGETAAGPLAPSESSSRLGRSRAGPAAASILRHLVRRLAAPSALAILLIGPLAAGIYAWLRRVAGGAWATYDGLVFVSLILSPLWAIISFRVLCPQTDAGSGVELLARFGAHRRALAEVQLVAVTLVSAALSAISAMLSVGITCDSWAAIANEAWAAVWISGLTGAAYAAVAVSATVALRSTAAPWMFLVLDWLLGGSQRLGSALFPRAHVHNLLGSPRCVDLPQFASWAALVGLLILALGLTALRTDA
jgi:hypothetical protein